MPFFRTGADPSLSDGIYERVVSEWLQERLEALEHSRVADTVPLPAEASTAYLARILHDAFLVVAEQVKGDSPDETAQRRVALTNELLGRMAEAGDRRTFRERELQLLPRLLSSIATRPALGAIQPAGRPNTSLMETDLLVNGDQRSVIAELLSEIDSADEIDLLCAFIKWSGFLKFREALQRHCQTRKRRLRVLTTTYLGATEARAVRALAELGAEVRISYETDTTRLHAKAWLFRRYSGYDTAYVGSSNLSHSALTDGLEWNVRVTNVDTPQVIERFRSVFESYWDNREAAFQHFEPSRAEELVAALRRARPGAKNDEGLPQLRLEVVPRGYQQDMLEQLELARSKGQRRNLVVAATGTGKTVVAALDFTRLHKCGEVSSLLFVAHRDQILAQSRALFEHIAGIRGELFVGGERPVEGKFVFASIQSLTESLKKNPPEPDAFDMVIVDEVHHAAAETYARLLRHVQPRLLLGLTATPERADGLPLTEFFPGPYAAELRVWDAIERQILVPFNYFGIDDGTDLSDLTWRRGVGYVASELRNKLVSSANIWVQKVVRAIADFVHEPLAMRALAFCVDIQHAQFVAEQLNLHGIPAQAVTSASDADTRRRATQQLRSNEVTRPRVLCVVDLYNEGIDLPEVDTIFFLRPTESPTVFLQQLGRGLRRAEGKDSLLVLDFIGKQYARFRFDLRYGALTGLGRRELVRSVEEQRFGRLPAGCTLQLERVAQQHVLRSLRQALPSGQKAMVDELRRLGAKTSLREFLEETGLTIPDLYRNGRCWSRLREAAGFDSLEVGQLESAALGRLSRVIHADDQERLSLWRRLAEEPQLAFRSERERRLARMLFALVYDLKWASQLEPALAQWSAQTLLRTELSALLPLLLERSTLLPRTLPLGAEIPFVGHARYLNDEISAAMELRSKEGSLYASQMGVVRLAKHDLLLTTLDKSAKTHLPHQQYRDYAISPTEFHWESQARTRIDDDDGQRHVNHRKLGITPVLFLREATKDERGETRPYCYLGPVEHLRHERERPIAVVWQLREPIPGDLLREARSAAA